MSLVVDQNPFLAAVRPFDRLVELERVKALKAMDIAYFQSGEELVRPRTSPAYLYVILKGVVREIAEDGSTTYLSRQDSFDGVGLLDGRTLCRFTAEEEVICYLLPCKVFHALCEANLSFRAYYSETLLARVAMRRDGQGAQEINASMTARIEEIPLHAPLYAEATTPLWEVVGVMHKHRTSAVLVRRGTETGIATLADLSNAVIVLGVPRTDPVGTYTTFSLVTLDAQALLFDALLSMTQHGLNHLVITRGSEIMGVLGQVDLLSFFSSHSYLVTLQIARATHLTELHHASTATLGVMRMLSDRGVKMRKITRLVGELDQRIFRKIYDMIVPADRADRVCWVWMGSEGRAERVFKGHADHLLLLRNDLDASELSHLSHAFREAVESLGYPPHREPFPWVKSVASLWEDLYQWLNHQTPRNRLNLMLFSDATAVAGETALLEEVREEWLNLVQHDAAYLALLAKIALRFETPLSLFAHFTLKQGVHQDALDIQQGGIFPIVHGVRVLALQQHLRMTNTAERIQALAERQILEPRLTQDLLEALDFMNQLRLQSGFAKREMGLSPDHTVRPFSLPKMDQDLLRDSFKVVNAFKKFLTFHFHLERLT